MPQGPKPPCITWGTFLPDKICGKNSFELKIVYFYTTIHTYFAWTIDKKMCFLTKICKHFVIFIIPRDSTILEHISLHIQEAFVNTERNGTLLENPEKTHFLALALNGQNWHYFFFKFKANCGQKYIFLAKLKITGINRHVLTILLVNGDLQSGSQEIL